LDQPGSDLSPTAIYIDESAVSRRGELLFSTKT